MPRRVCLCKHSCNDNWVQLRRQLKAASSMQSPGTEEKSCTRTENLVVKFNFLFVDKQILAEMARLYRVVEISFGKIESNSW